MLCKKFDATEAANRSAAVDRTADSVAEAEHEFTAQPVAFAVRDFPWYSFDDDDVNIDEDGWGILGCSAAYLDLQDRPVVTSFCSTDWPVRSIRSSVTNRRQRSVREVL